MMFSFRLKKLPETSEYQLAQGIQPKIDEGGSAHQQ
jgi:hypothetical protein